MSGSRSLFAGLTIGIALACASPAAAENVLRWASAGGAVTFDPHAYDELQTTIQVRAVYESLITYSSDLELVPALAVSWRLIGPTTWEFELRPDVRFQDGTPFAANDVVFSFARARIERPANLAARIESIADVRAIDERTVHIETKSPDPQLWDKVSTIAIMSERWAAAHDARIPAEVSARGENHASRHANGTGPFILKEFEPEGQVALVRNPDWWGRADYPLNVDRIEYTPIADAEARLEALLKGDLELLTDPPFAALDRIKSTRGLKLAQAPELRAIWLGLDQASRELRSSNIKGSNPFKDKRVRQAIYQAIDIEAIRADVMRGLAIPAGMLAAPGAIGYAPELDKRLPYDPEAAKALLAAAGYPEGFTVTLDCPNNSNYVNDEAICLAVAAQLHEVGIDVTTDLQPKQVYWPKLDNRETDFWLDSWSAIDSHFIFVRQYRTGDSANVSGYSNPRVDVLIDQIDRELITYGRDAMIEEVWRIVLDEIVYIPLHHQVIVWAMRDNLDLPVSPFNVPIFREARFTAPKVN
jgi:peptide/nickel transport system substrate-binding protein